MHVAVALQVVRAKPHPAGLLAGSPHVHLLLDHVLHNVQQGAEHLLNPTFGVRHNRLEAHPGGGDQLIDRIPRSPGVPTVHRVTQTSALDHVHHETGHLIGVRAVPLPGQEGKVLILKQRDRRAGGNLDVPLNGLTLAGLHLVQGALAKDDRRPRPHADSGALLAEQPVQIRQEEAHRPEARHAHAGRVVGCRPQPKRIHVGRGGVFVLGVVDDLALDVVRNGLRGPPLGELHAATVLAVHSGKVFQVRLVGVPAVGVQGQYVPLIDFQHALQAELPV